MTTTELYRSITADKRTHHRTITAAIAKLAPDRRLLINAYAKGLTDREVGSISNRSHGAARSMLTKTMWAIHNKAHNLPRYHVIGRLTKAEQRARQATPGPLRSHRDFFTAAERERLA